MCRSDGNVKKEINDALDQGKRVIFDNQPGQHLASENAPWRWA